MASHTLSNKGESLESGDSISESPTPPNDEENPLPSKEKRGEEKDPNLVDWDGDADPENPRNWSNTYKSWITVQLGMLALAASLGSSIIAPADDAISKDMVIDKEVTVLVVSLYM